jgi:dTDP-4-amino-4,6-dideoxygalactose transaminase
MASLAYSIVDQFEKTIAEFAGSKYGVAVESGTAALFLSCVYNNVSMASIPKHTYVSVPCQIIHAGGKVKFRDEQWQGEYEIKPYGIWDSALRFKRGMYHGGFQCLSFHAKKLLPIGRGGMILTNDKAAYEWFKKARFDGRDQVPMEEDNFTMLGYNMYMTPEQAARGLQLFDMIKTLDLPDLDVNKQKYPDLSKFPIYQGG